MVTVWVVPPRRWWGSRTATGKTAPPRPVRWVIIGVVVDGQTRRTDPRTDITVTR